jgi:hypothetical protein
MLSNVAVSIVNDPPKKPVDSSLGNTPINSAMQDKFKAALEAVKSNGK